MIRSATSLIILLTVTIAGCSGGASRSEQSRGRAPAPDPALRAASAVVALERDPTAAITAAQAAQILPWLRVLREMRPDDTEAAQTIADEIFAVLTPEQRAALRALAEEARQRQGPPGGQRTGPPGAGPGAGPRPGIGPGGGPPDPARRAEFRRRVIERAIRLLEGKVSP